MFNGHKVLTESRATRATRSAHHPSAAKILDRLIPLSAADRDHTSMCGDLHYEASPTYALVRGRPRDVTPSGLRDRALLPVEQPLSIALVQSGVTAMHTT